ncbi:ABC transporter ATP-binding protein [Vibrio pacinii]|uniref:ABC transporter ATP-binding protein n=1 Tax=Vibrio pacinii TaxID=170674 RepID=UPI000A055DF6|nr:ABC transporter ATP-binding protein [Vibrio pacinii]
MSSIIVKNLTLDYPIRNKININKKSDTSVGGRIFEKDGMPYLRAIDDICLEIQSGDRVGIIGHNGAGKSTLLKTLAGIYKPTSGTVNITGKVAPLFNLKFGMDMELTGYENIVLRALYLGVPRHEVLKKREEIALLSDLGDFLHLPMKSYSSGMVARLAFAVSVKIDADILLLDEMIGTGDANFINKTSEMAEDFVASSNILLLASHSNKVIREICNKAIVFEHGKIVDFTSVDEALSIYKSRSESHHQKVNGIPSLRYDDVVEGSKKYTLINDCSLDLNSYNIRKSLSMLMGNKVSCIANVSFEQFSENYSEPNKAYWINKRNKFSECLDDELSSVYQKWLCLKEKIRQNREIFNKIDELDSDFFVISSSQHFSNNSQNSLIFFSIVALVSEIKPVAVLNLSAFNVDHEILKDSLSKVDLVHVKDNFAKKYLNLSGIGSINAPDISSAYISTLEYDKNLIIDSKQRLGLISLDGLNNESLLKEIIELFKSKDIKPVYLSMEEYQSGKDKDICISLDIEHMDIKTFNPKLLLVFLGQFDLIVSSSHKLNLFALRVESNLICLPTDSFCVEGTLGYISDDIPVAYCTRDLTLLIDKPKIRVSNDPLGVFYKRLRNSLTYPMNQLLRNV